MATVASLNPLESNNLCYRGIVGGVDVHTDLAGQLFGIVGRFRRQLRRSTRGGFDTDGLTQSQVELLRLVGRQPGISVREAAAELALAPNTASTLVSRLVGDGMLVRTVDPADRRVGRLQLTEPAQQIADESRAARRAALAEVLDRLDADERADLARGLAVLSQITRMLQKETTP
ncbi:transcriptional regulator [Mycolicibacterium aurum]|uniref:Transcriptional regulator n=1 Tax=Mycolicibacterium aurum TaxID=1791 RepID=A0A3S4S7Z9_MYCAU|nr:transcriptional regulator [Mycolicibacterium aurum]